jgi:flagellar motor switch protein FliN/FliY
MSEILSQDQINSLLGQKDLTGAGLSMSDDSPAASAAVKDYGALAKVFELYIEQASTVISTILNKQVSCEIVRCDKTDAAAAQTSIGSPQLLLTIPFKTGANGPLYCVMAKKDVAFLSDLMMMGDGTAAYTEDHKDAIVELMGQVMGSFTTALGGKFNEQVSIDAITPAEFDFADPGFALETTDMAIVKTTLAGGNACQMLFLTPDELGMELMNKMARATRTDGTGGEIGAGLSGLTEMGSSHEGNSGQGDSFVETSLSSDSLRSSANHENIDILLDVDLDVFIELGRTNLSIKRVLELAPGSIVELDRMAGEPVDLLVNDKVVAKGEVVVVDENFGIRIVSLVSAEDRIKSLR